MIPIPTMNHVRDSSVHGGGNRLVHMYVSMLRVGFVRGFILHTYLVQ